MPIAEILQSLAVGTPLSRAEARAVMDQVVDGGIAPAQVAELLLALRKKGESAEEISGFLDSLRARAVEVPVGVGGVIDVCGTGGDGAGTFNVSTAAAFVCAAAGLPVAKHGNRSVSSRCGSFDVLEALGLRFHSEPRAVGRALERFGIAFLLAPSFHPALRSVGQVRRGLGVSTVFNILGPLLNPVEVSYQLVGAYSSALLPTMAEVLRVRRLKRAMVVRGEDGLDEISPAGRTEVSDLEGGAVRSYWVSPKDFGDEFGERPRSVAGADLRGGDARENAAIIVSILGGERGAKRDAVVLNAAAALVVGGKARDFRDGAAQAASTIDSGRAARLLERLRESG